MSLTAAEIYLSKSHKINLVNIHPKGKKAHMAEAVTFNRNLNSLGFTLHPQLLAVLAAHEPDEILKFYNETFPVLMKMVGAHRSFKPMYPNFPKQVIEASDLELYMNAMMHYWGAFVGDVLKIEARWLPEYPFADRKLLPEDEISLKVITLGNKEDFNTVFTRLVGSNGSLSESNKTIIDWFVENRKEVISDLLPAAIPQKENLAYIVGAFLKHELGVTKLLPYLKTATDVLRVAVAQSNGDVSLAANTKFRRFKRSERRFLLSAMEAIGMTHHSITEDMFRRPEVWKRLGRELRPGDYSATYPKTLQAFKIIRNNEEFQTFNGIVERNIKEDAESAATILMNRPGDFARRLDHLLRTAGEGVYGVLERFLGVADKVSTPVLLQVFAHFKHRAAEGHLLKTGMVDGSKLVRAFFPKGSVAKCQLVEGALPPLDIAEEVAVAVRKVLVKRFSKLPSFGKVYLDPNLTKQFIPFAQRSASKSLRTISRGSRMPLPDCTTIRFFVWWHDGTERTDIDLSAAMLDENFNNGTTVSYYNLRESGCTHSGDITSAPKGAAEFIDVEIDKILAQGHRYIVMMLNSFTHQPYKDLPECFAGWMARTEPQSGEIFEARTVRDKVDITADSTIAIPLILDLKDRQMIWADLSLKSRPSLNNVKSNRAGMSKMAQAIATLCKPTLYDLFDMHAEARGERVKRDEADTIFSLFEGITPFDQDKIMSEFMA